MLVMVEVLMLALGRVLGSALGYWSVLLRVWRLEKELVEVLEPLDLEKVKELQTAQDWVKIEASVEEMD